MPSPGYATLKRSDPTLYKQVRAYLTHAIDQLDWGFRTVLGKSRANSTDKLIEWREYLDMPAEMRKHRRGYYKAPAKLSLRRCQDHAEGDILDTIYVCSNPRATVATLCVDIDDHDGTAADVGAARQLIDGIIPTASIYWQASTSGTGLHGYFWIRSTDPVALRSWAKTLEQHLQGQARSADITAVIEIKGQPPILAVNGTYKTRGILIKLPRLSIDEWRTYLRLVPLTQDHFTLTASTPSPPRPAAVATRRTQTHDCLIGASSPLERLNNCSFQLTRRLRRAPTADEIWDEYHAQGLNTGEDHDGNRRELCERQAAYLAAHFNPSLASTWEGQRDRLIPEAQSISEEIRAQVRVKNRFTFTDEIAAVALFCVERSQVKKQLKGTVPVAGIIAMCQELGVEVLGTPEVQRKRCSAALTALTLSGVITTNGKWSEGISRTFSLGE